MQDLEIPADSDRIARIDAGGRFLLFGMMADQLHFREPVGCREPAPAVRSVAIAAFGPYPHRFRKMFTFRYIALC